ncbi:PTS glucose transporter subunit IIA [Kroppenstedtia guangzhouensis]|uniref:PTS glucose transporter subunit IIA n=1 Tax=Kroppenstedtia guangzhouensis TaxID=1274356 RepID=A0ABQ1GPH7_9BACL|nr:PTS glucose transporter subunit IIA [Kroppenstedtia guangzhouensis]GGA47847.1 PTS glucose transporter subunit IIA [Kroppenstedtia guangzhouensis]
MFRNWFGKKQKSLVLSAPLKGKLVPLDQVPDPVFSEKMMGDGAAMEPAEGVLRAPVDGEVIQLFHTKHAVGIRSVEGLEVLLHIGLETVAMEGEGFSAEVKEGDQVKTGQPLIQFSLETVREQAKSIVTPIVITNMDRVDRLELKSMKEADPGDPILAVTLKSS